MNGTASHSTILAVVVGMAVIQVVVHLVYFLHMNTSSEERWNLVALLFTAMIIGIVVVGSLWIMYNLNINMMVD
jgi:cytochrome o ubiquinol oxidase operon protein cyoD